MWWQRIRQCFLTEQQHLMYNIHRLKFLIFYRTQRILRNVWTLLIMNTLKIWNSLNTTNSSLVTLDSQCPNIPTTWQSMIWCFYQWFCVIQNKWNYTVYGGYFWNTFLYFIYELLLFSHSVISDSFLPPWTAACQASLSFTVCRAFCFWRPHCVVVPQFVHSPIDKYLECIQIPACYK